MNYIGIDIGSISVKAILMDENGHIFDHNYIRTHGQPIKTTINVLKNITKNISNDDKVGLSVTGSGGILISDILNGYFINEIIAQSKSTSRLYPDIRTIIEIGGEDSKMIKLEKDENSKALRLKDFNMNTVCAAGTGSFLDQQAARLGVSIENEFGELAVKSLHPPRIAGRCSVFAKSDMIHLQQVATPSHDIVMGLCLALARNFKSNVIKGVPYSKPISFQGGVAANKGMIKAFEETLNLKAEELFIPEYYAYMGAIGSVFSMIESGNIKYYQGLEKLEKYLHKKSGKIKRHEPLVDDNYSFNTDTKPIEDEAICNGYLGIDVGSISTNLVVINDKKEVISRRYLKTGGNPLEAVKKGLKEIGDEIGNKVVIHGAATTGSGRYLTGDFIGADVVKNEITAHAAGALNVNPKVDTIFEIGGQDSKYISLKNGKVEDFTMNKVCAAGTGSFLEEQSEKLGVNIKEEFSKLALKSENPSALGERCTVFMESSLNHQQQLGVSKEDLAAGLSYSIAMNYLTTVVEDRKVGDVIFFQGGTAFNRGVKAAFEKICKKKIIVPPHHDVLGAMGAAILAKEQKDKDKQTKFKGFDLAKRSFNIDSFECEKCSNNCKIRVVSIEGEAPLKYGSRCGIFDEEKRVSKGKSLPKLFQEREKMLFKTYEPSTKIDDNAPVIGIPRTLLFYEMYPFWNAFFSELGFKVIISPASGKSIINQGCETVVEEVCYPIKVGVGHVLYLLNKNVDYIFIPSIINAKTIINNNSNSGLKTASICPLVQGFPFMVKATIEESELEKSNILTPAFHFGYNKKFVGNELKEFALSLGCKKNRINNAIDKGFENLRNFQKSITDRGKEILNNLPEDKPSLVLVSRPYNGCDSGLNLQIPDKLRDFGILTIPADFIPVSENDVPHLSSMYWRYGQRILSVADYIANNPKLNAVYMTNFACGPDSFIIKYFNKIMKDKHFLTLELDEHSGDAGVLTRLEAFLDSLESCEKVIPQTSKTVINKSSHPPCSNHRKIYIPHMDDHSVGFAAAMRYYGVDAEALPISDSKSLELAKKHTTGKECYPFLITAGDFLRKATSNDFDINKAGFFMPTSNGPCRFGQYCYSHKMILEEAGLKNTEMIILDQSKNYDDDLKKLGAGFRKLGWQAIVAIDNIKKVLYHTRPYEVNKGETNKVYNDCLEHLAKTIENKGSVKESIDYCIDKFKSIKVDRTQKKPVIGIIGEIFVRSNHFTNNFIINKIEDLGGEAVISTLSEWVFYTDWERQIELKRMKHYGSYYSELLKSAIQKNIYNKCTKPFSGMVKNFLYEQSPDDLMKLSNPYITEEIRGETTLSMARAEEYALHGLNGVVNLIPFHCIPGTIANTLLKKFSKKYPKVPVLKMVYDGTEQSSDDTKLEAFMFQAKQIMNLQKVNT